MNKEHYWKEWRAHAAADNTHKRVAELIAESIAEPSGKKTLDIPCGAGAFSKFLESQGFDVSALDIGLVDDFLYDPARLKLADINDGIPFDDDSFDLVVSIEGIEHLENPSFFLRECSRVIKPEGLIVLTTPNVDSFRSRRKSFFDGYQTSFNPESASTKTSGHMHPIDMVFFRGAAQRAGLTIDKVTINKVREGAVTRSIYNFLRPYFTRKLPREMRGEIPFFGDVVIYVLRPLASQR